MIAFNVESNVKEFVRYLDKVEKKQVPFATARALTWTAKESQKVLQRAMPLTFNVTKKWWGEKQPTGIKVKGADKRKTDLEATVYTLAYFAKLQEEGGIKIPLGSRGILVPTESTPKSARKSGGAVKIISGKKVLKFAKRTRRRKTKAAKSTTAVGGSKRRRRRQKRTRPELVTADPIATMPSGARGVFRRKTKARLPIERVYSYVPRAKVRERMQFKTRAYQCSLRVFDGIFARSLTQALREAR